MLPKVIKVKERKNYFPTKWQTVIFRNYGFVDTEKIGAVLGCDAATVDAEANRLGLPLAERSLWELWEKRGYITIIRNNWYLLPYEQLLTLLGIDGERLEFILTNDDFLSVKLGDFKPECETVLYAPLTESQKTATAAIAQTVKRLLSNERKQPFDFFSETTVVSETEEIGGRRIVHGYLSPCGDVFMEDDGEYLPDKLLLAYQNSGVNGLWFHGMLATLSPYPFDSRASEHYQERRKRLNHLIQRCAKYGIKVYLYLNEPRGLPQERLGKYAYLAGRKENGFATLCLEKQETQDYLYNAVKDLLENVRGLGGFITITMSENPTHCNFRPHTNCPICKNIPPEQSAAKVNNIIHRAIKDSDGNVELIANLWGWSPFMEWTEEQTLRGVELLDKDISVLCVSEYNLAIQKGGVDGRVIDYSISNVGPSEITCKTLQKARETGHKVYAKIQTNNSWECSAVPCLPVFDLIYEHLHNLSALGVEDYMLTWTLGGWPSPALSLTSAYAKDGVDFSLEKWYKAEFGNEYIQVWKAVRAFCQAFQEYPFSIASLYNSPKTLGEANLYDLEKEELQSTMVCFAYDDYKMWTEPYPVETYLSQYEKLLTKWKEGLTELSGIQTQEKTPKIDELRLYAEGAYSHFYSDYLQTRFSLLKNDMDKNRAEIINVLRASLQNAETLINLIYQDAKIGFETSNHYFYTDRNLVEKIVNVQQLLETLLQSVS